jgi:hypothetical protein
MQPVVRKVYITCWRENDRGISHHQGISKLIHFSVSQSSLLWPVDTASLSIISNRCHSNRTLESAACVRNISDRSLFPALFSANTHTHTHTHTHTLLQVLSSRVRQYLLHHLHACDSTATRPLQLLIFWRSHVDKNYSEMETSGWKATTGNRKYGQNCAYDLIRDEGQKGEENIGL